MTDDEAIALYRKKFASTPIVEKDERENVAEAVRECLEANSLDQAIQVLKKWWWDLPRECAIMLRGAKECPTCKGEGVI